VRQGLISDSCIDLSSKDWLKMTIDWQGSMPLVDAHPRHMA
jgi:hypothetical protein